MSRLDTTDRWDPERAWAWFDAAEPIRGFNYLPRTAVNTIDMWEADTFDAATIEQELGWAADAGYNAARILLHFLVWRQDPKGLTARIDRLLDLAHRRGIAIMLTPFDDCSSNGYTDPRCGPQGDPLPSSHNSRWTCSPGHARVADRAAWPELERYVKDLVGTFGRDPRVHAWDLYNEPGQGIDVEVSMCLVDATFAWARSLVPTQPLTVGPWKDYDAPASQRMIELSDVVSFHCYSRPSKTGEIVADMARHGRPLLCTEWLNRCLGNTYADILPIFAEHRVGWYQWGLVNGRTQTHLPWTCRPGDAPGVWQHDVLHADGAPYDASEMAMLRELAKNDRGT